jgi:hypothetical protein
MPLDMTTMLRPFFWLAVGVLVLAPIVFALARDSVRRPSPVPPPPNRRRGAPRVGRPRRGTLGGTSRARSG